jgi:hypothetical protein
MTTKNMRLFGIDRFLRGAISCSLLLVLFGASCRAVEPLSSSGFNRENERLCNIIYAYFYISHHKTSFADMSNAKRLATINSLRKEVRVGSKLLFFEISLSGQFTPIDASENIDAQLASCALTPEEIARVKHQAGSATDPYQSKHPPRSDSKGLWGYNGHNIVLRSSKYDVYDITCYKYDNTDTQEVYRAACCLILSPPDR